MQPHEYLLKGRIERAEELPLADIHSVLAHSELTGFELLRVRGNSYRSATSEVGSTLCTVVLHYTSAEPSSLMSRDRMHMRKSVDRVNDDSSSKETNAERS
jgi:hypothetical protein